MPDKVDELRAELKRKRIEEENERRQNEIRVAGPDSGQQPASSSNAPRTDSTSTTVEQYSPIISRTDQRSSEPVTGRIHRAIGPLRAIGNTQRELSNRDGSNAPDSVGTGQGDRRSGNDHSENRSDGDNLSTGITGRSSRQRRQVGNLETTEPVPPRFFKDEEETTTNPQAIAFPGTTEPLQRRKRGRPPKQKVIETSQGGIGSEPTKERKIIPFLQGNVLSKFEATELEEPLLHALTSELELLDKALWEYSKNTPRGSLQQPIWSNISEEEMHSLSNILLKLGQKSPTVATVTRIAVDGSDYVNAAMLIAPRFGATVQVFKEVRLQKQQEKANNPNAQNRNIRQRLRTQ